MFAIVANGYQGIVKTQRQLDTIIAIYPYPKFQKCATEDLAREWLRCNSRSYMNLNHNHYGDTNSRGYVSVEYYIVDNAILYNIKTDKIGYIRVEASNDTLVDSRRELLKVKVINVKLDDMLIPHHIVAIRRILNLLGGYIDVDLVVPDISIFLAITKYTGANYLIKGLQRDIASRLGGVSITIKE